MSTIRVPQALGVALACLFLPRLAPADNTVQWTTNYYSITGATMPEIRQSIRQSRPWKNRVDLDGLTEWRVTWNFAVAGTEDGCRCNTLKTRTTVSITLPRWLTPTNAEPRLIETWGRYAAALMQHELGHAQNGVAAAEELRRRIQAAGDRPTCAALSQVIKDIGERTIAEFRRRDKDYDERTGHGATQGAILPGRGRRER